MSREPALVYEELGFSLRFVAAFARHFSFSHPGEVAQLIETAAEAVPVTS